jgi:hypothetical protein
MEIQDFCDYLIYKDGRVWSNTNNIFLKYGKTGGYLYVGLRNGGIKPINKYIHRLIAEHYIPNPENKPEVDHIDRDKTNNRIENLRWVTRKENQENRGLHKTNTSGHKYIYWDKSNKRWIFRIQGRNKKQRYFKTNIDYICYKFYYLLKINYNSKNLINVFV